jgi:hypothetical protein
VLVFVVIVVIVQMCNYKKSTCFLWERKKIMSFRRGKKYIMAGKSEKKEEERKNGIFSSVVFCVSCTSMAGPRFGGQTTLASR